jgi:hypothetical protein
MAFVLRRLLSNVRIRGSSSTIKTEGIAAPYAFFPAEKRQQGSERIFPVVKIENTALVEKLQARGNKAKRVSCVSEGSAIMPRITRHA